MKERAKIIWVLKEGCDPDTRLIVRGSFFDLLAGVISIFDSILELQAEKKGLSVQKVKKEVLDVLKEEWEAAE